MKILFALSLLFASAASFAAVSADSLSSRLPSIFARSAAHYRELDAKATPLRKGEMSKRKGRHNSDIYVPYSWKKSDGQGVLDMRPIYWWTSGHFPGTLWYLYEATGDAFFKDRALAWMGLLSPNSTVDDNHDVGFIMYCSFGNARRLLKSDRYDAMLKETSESLCRRFDDSLGLIRSWGKIGDKKDFFRVNPDEYITCGFSAGGYITCLWNTEAGYEKYGIPKPKACFPIYPVTSYRLMDAEEWDEGEDKDEFARFGLGVDMATACNSCFEIPEHVEGFPMTALFLAAEDELVDPEHSKKLAEALNKANIPCRLEIGPAGGHGFADGVGMCMEGWPERAIRWFEEQGNC